jgi:hypothetical protein
MSEICPASAELIKVGNVQAAAWPPAYRGERPLPQSVRPFLIESERRVILHCQKLLAQTPCPVTSGKGCFVSLRPPRRKSSGWPAIEAA